MNIPDAAFYASNAICAIGGFALASVFTPKQASADIKLAAAWMESSISAARSLGRKIDAHAELLAAQARAATTKDALADAKVAATKAAAVAAATGETPSLFKGWALPETEVVKTSVPAGPALPNAGAEVKSAAVVSAADSLLL